MAGKKQTDTIVFTNEHAGHSARGLIGYLEEQGYNVIDCGAKEFDGQDGGPQYIKPALEALLSNPGSMGLFTCGSGQIMSMMANKIPGLNAAVCRSVDDAKSSREHNNARVLCPGARCNSYDELIKIADTFFTTAFLKGKYAERMDQIDRDTAEIMEKFGIVPCPQKKMKKINGLYVPNKEITLK